MEQAASPFFVCPPSFTTSTYAKQRHSNTSYIPENKANRTGIDDQAAVPCQASPQPSPTPDADGDASHILQQLPHSCLSLLSSRHGNGYVDQSGADSNLPASLRLIEQSAARLHASSTPVESQPGSLELHDSAPTAVVYFALCPTYLQEHALLFIRDVGSYYTAHQLGSHMPGSVPQHVPCSEGIVAYEGRPTMASGVNLLARDRSSQDETCQLVSQQSSGAEPLHPSSSEGGAGQAHHPPAMPSNESATHAALERIVTACVQLQGGMLAQPPQLRYISPRLYEPSNFAVVLYVITPTDDVNYAVKILAAVMSVFSPLLPDSGQPCEGGVGTSSKATAPAVTSYDAAPQQQPQPLMPAHPAGGDPTVRPQPSSKHPLYNNAAKQLYIYGAGSPFCTTSKHHSTQALHVTPQVQYCVAYFNLSWFYSLLFAWF